MTLECEDGSGQYDRSAPGRHDYLNERTDMRDVHVLHAGQMYELPLVQFWEKQVHPYQAVPVMLSRQQGSYGCCEKTRCARSRADAPATNAHLYVLHARSTCEIASLCRTSQLAGKLSQRQLRLLGPTPGTWHVASSLATRFAARPQHLCTSVWPI
jgi:hypothetical protein